MFFRPLFICGMPLNSKLFESAHFFLLKLIIFFLSPGSMPFANNLRASSRRALASARDTSGYTPKASIFYFPPKRYCRCQYLKLLGWASRCIPLPSVSLYCLSVGLAVLTLISVSAMLIPSLLVQALSNRKYHHLHQDVLVDVS